MKSKHLLTTLFLVLPLAIVSGGVYAGNIAQAQNTQTVTSGAATLSATLLGTSSNVNNMGFTTKRHQNIEIKNTGNLALKNVTYELQRDTLNNLTTGTTKGLSLRYALCSVPWQASGACQGTTTSLRNETYAANMTPLNLSNRLEPGQVLNLKIQYSFSNQTETVTNGNTPADSVAGLTADLTHVFKADQVDSTGTTRVT